jgi:hypothetical protein
MSSSFTDNKIRLASDKKISPILPPSIIGALFDISGASSFEDTHPAIKLINIIAEIKIDALASVLIIIY